ncbi:MAG: alpha-2-macroglobulin, partial [Elusimicrobia bacterium]|nr:alpha-2-macroglobulin [Elusimicrobiota bacterium]
MRALIFFLFIGRAEAAPQLEQFSPQGVVKQVRQVTARFPEPMVPFGDPRGLVEPFAVVCPATGTARWADPRHWVFDFDRDLPAGVQCEFTLKEGLTTLSGAELTGQRSFSFSTGGPSVRASRPYQGGRVDEDQMFVLTLDAEPDPKSVEENVSISIEGLAQRVEVRIVTGAERERVLKAAGPDSYWSEEEDGPRAEPLPRLVLQAKQAFPPDTRLTLVWGKGVRAPSGVATEQDQLLAFQSRPAFTAKFSCERVDDDEGCLPIGAMQVVFSAPVSWERAKGVALDDGKKKRRPVEPKHGASDGEDPSFVQSVAFEGPFPPAARFTVLLPPKGLVDDAGRTLVNAGSFPLEVRTGEYPPLAKFPARFGVIELKGEPVLPFTVRNLEAQVALTLLKVDGGTGRGEGLLEKLRGRLLKVGAGERVPRLLQWLDRAQRYEHEWNTSLFAQAGSEDVKSFSIPKPNGAKAFEVIGLPLKEPGLYVVELESRILGEALRDKPEPMFVPTAALVTNLSVHLKWGRESSVVWVTALDTGAPVPAAEVTVSDCKGATLWSGATDAVGLARVPALPEPSTLPRCDELKGPMRSARLIALAKAGDDFSFVVDSWTEGIEAWRFQVPYEWQERASDRVHTVLDRSLLRAGETVHMKHLLRRRTGSGFAVPQQREAPKTLVITHAGSEQEYVLPVTFDAGGVAESTWEIPRDAKLGEYALSFKGEAEGPRWDGSTSLRVEEFRVPLMRASIRTPQEAPVAPAAVPLDLSVTYLSGGGAEGLPVKLRSQVRPKPSTSFPAFEGFSFGNGPAVERSRREGPGPREPELRAFELTLDRTGAGRVVVPDIPPATLPRELAAELEFRDPNGEVQTVSARVPLWPSKRLVGIKADSWTTSKKSVKAQVAVVDLSGKP